MKPKPLPPTATRQRFHILSGLELIGWGYIERDAHGRATIIDAFDFHDEPLQLNQTDFCLQLQGEPELIVCTPKTVQ